jgi:hypothetical protein
MRLKLTLLTGVALLAASPAFAQTSVTGTVNVTGFVESKCQFASPGSESIDVGKMNADTGVLDPTRINGQAKILKVWCNQASASMEVEALPLLNTASAGAGFSNRVDFTATAKLGAAVPNDTSTTAGAGTPQNVGLSSGDIEVTLSGAATAGGPLLVAGKYDGKVLVTLRPNGTPAPTPSPESPT